MLPALLRKRRERNKSSCVDDEAGLRMESRDPPGSVFADAGQQKGVFCKGASQEFRRRTIETITTHMQDMQGGKFACTLRALTLTWTQQARRLSLPNLLLVFVIINLGISISTSIISIMISSSMIGISISSIISMLSIIVLLSLMIIIILLLLLLLVVVVVERRKGRRLGRGRGPGRGSRARAREA